MVLLNNNLDQNLTSEHLNMLGLDMIITLWNINKIYIWIWTIVRILINQQRKSDNHKKKNKIDPSSKSCAERI